MFKNRKPDTAVHWSICDGRQLAGTVDKIDGLFTACNLDGELVGTFPTLRAAARAFDIADDDTENLTLIRRFRPENWGDFEGRRLADRFDEILSLAGGRDRTADRRERG